jgi:hypothetical protein
MVYRLHQATAERKTGNNLDYGQRYNKQSAHAMDGVQQNDPLGNSHPQPIAKSSYYKEPHYYTQFPVKAESGTIRRPSYPSGERCTVNRGSNNETEGCQTNNGMANPPVLAIWNKQNTRNHRN